MMVTDKLSHIPAPGLVMWAARPSALLTPAGIAHLAPVCHMVVKLHTSRQSSSHHPIGDDIVTSALLQKWHSQTRMQSLHLAPADFHMQTARLQGHKSVDDLDKRVILLIVWYITESKCKCRGAWSFSFLDQFQWSHNTTFWYWRRVMFRENLQPEPCNGGRCYTSRKCMISIGTSCVDEFILATER